MKIGITTFGGDGGKSGISQYIINILKEFAALEDRPDFEVIVYEDEKELFVPDPDSMSTICFGDSLRSPVANITWHQISLPKLCRKQKYDVLFLPAGNRRLPVARRGSGAGSWTVSGRCRGIWGEGRGAN